MSIEPRHRHGSRRTERPRRFGAAGVAGIVVAALAAAPIQATSASWMDAEWVHESGIGALNCSAPEVMTSTASGRVLSGSLLGLDLDTVAALDGVVTVNDGITATAGPGADQVGPATFVDPLDVSALAAVNLALGNLLVLPLDTPVGVVNQYARAESSGYSAGAAGAVADSGGIQLTPVAEGDEMPVFATIELADLLTAATGQQLSDLVTGLADIRLMLGAVASATTLDGCGALWSGDVYAELDRQYVIAGMEAQLDIPAVGALTTTVSSTLGTIETTVEGLVDDVDLLAALGTGLLAPTGPLQSLLSDLLGVGTPTVTLGLELDLSAVQSLLTATVPASGGPVSVDLGAGLVTVDLASLLGPSYQDSVGLNGLAPNTQLLINDTALNALLASVTAALNGWVATVQSAITAALAGVQVDVRLLVPVQIRVLGLYTVTFVSLQIDVEGDLAAMLAGDASGFEVDVSFITAACNLGTVVCGIVGGALVTLLNGLLGTVTAVTEAALALLVGQIVSGAIATATGPLLSTLLSTLNGLVASIVSTLSAALNGLFGEDSALSLVVNAQNDPDPAEVHAGPEPGWAAALPGPTNGATGRFDVSALRVVVLGPLAGGVAVDLARSSAGSNTLVG